jgi:succinate dehydrogenase / fumarate reductase cytochrome b subunit
LFHVTTTTSSPAARARASTIVWKLAMAVSGLVFIGYLILHMYGNLKVFSGQVAFDEYAHHLRVFGEPMLPENGLLWVVRLVLIVSLLVHAGAAFKLWARASNARTTKYQVKKAVAASLSSRVMRWGGVALLLFVIFHLLHLTTHTINPGGNPASPYQRMVNGFSPENWWVPVVYLLAMAALAMHLRHGVWSAAQTLGLTNTAKARARWNVAGYLTALVVAGGFALVPLSILFGIVD